MGLLLAANNQATRRNQIIRSLLPPGSSSNGYAPRLPQQGTKSSTKQLAPTDPILGPENLLKTGFAQKGLPSSDGHRRNYRPDLTMQWSTLGSFMQELSLLVIDEGQQYGTDREIAVLSLLKQQRLVLWTGDSQQTPSGIAQAAPNAKRSRQLLLAKKHGLRSDRNYFMPSYLAEGMIRLLEAMIRLLVTIPPMKDLPF